MHIRYPILFIDKNSIKLSDREIHTDKEVIRQMFTIIAALADRVEQLD